MVNKKKEVEILVQELKKNPVIGIASIYKMPASQLQKIRLEMLNQARIRVAKRRLTLLALSKIRRSGLLELGKKMTGPTALIFSQLDPFQLEARLREKRVPAAAKAGDFATADIMIPEGDTGLAPGPAISQFQKLGIKTSVKEGKIHVVESKVVAKKGDKISAELANVLNLLGIKPLKIGLNLLAAWYDGIVFDQSDLRIDAKEWFDKYLNAVKSALALSVESGYLVPETAEMIITKACCQALGLGLEAVIYEEKILEKLLVQAAASASALKSAAG